MHHGISVDPRVGDAPLLPYAGDQPSPFAVLLERQIEQPEDFLLGVLGRSEGTMLDDNQVESASTPAGFTFFGQFIDHDITFMLSPPRVGEEIDLNLVRNRRTPRLDLDSVFGRGPFDPTCAALYYPDTLELRLSENGRDIIRTGSRPEGRLIGDPRNDENLIVVQLHVAFMRLYNHFIQQQPSPRGETEYLAARMLTVQHYQHYILNEYLPTIIGKDAVDAARKRGASRYMEASTASNVPFLMPVEFAFGAFRFGHTQLRDGYALNADTGRPLFNVEVRGQNGSPGDLTGNQPVTDNLVIDWSLFFFNPASPPAQGNMSRRFDTKLSRSLHRLRPPSINDLPISLAERNLRRGRSALLPSGQKAARMINQIDPNAQIFEIPRDQLGFSDEVLRTQEELTAAGSVTVDIRDNTPLWYYILREAEMPQDQGGGGGQKLAGVGAWILAETFIGLMLNDPESVLSKPFTPAAGFGTLAEAMKNL